MTDGVRRSSYQPQHGDVLTKNGVSIHIILATDSQVIFSVNILGEDKGQFFKTSKEFLADVRRYQPKLERGAEVVGDRNTLKGEKSCGLSANQTDQVAHFTA